MKSFCSKNPRGPSVLEIPGAFGARLSVPSLPRRLWRREPGASHGFRGGRAGHGGGRLAGGGDLEGPGRRGAPGFDGRDNTYLRIGSVSAYSRSSIPGLGILKKRTY